MPEHYKHVFLIPLRKIEQNIVTTIRELSQHDAKKFGFLISIQENHNYKLCSRIFAQYKNILVIHPDNHLERTSHWQYIARQAEKHLNFSSFSYFFSGDDININNFPDISGDEDIYINDYYINSWDNVKENASSEAILRNGVEGVIHRNLLLGKPLFAPLQKIIFSRRAAAGIKFNKKYSYVSDHLLVFNLMQKGATVRFIKQPFYRLNENERTHRHSLSLPEVIRQQVCLYRELKCYPGIPMIIFRTLVKYLIFKKY